MLQSNELLTNNVCNWCTGCGNFAIWTSFKRAAEKQGWKDGNTVIVAGIGCHGHIINFTKISAFEGLHGRAIPVASGLKMANHKLNVMVFTGDGDCLSEGGNHFIHAAKRNQDLTVVLHDNAIYGLTTGQASSRSPKGFITKSTPGGKIEEPLNPLTLAITAGATFVARTYAGDIEQTTKIMIEASKHKGFALVDVLQPCVTFNREYSHSFYQSNIYELSTEHDTTDKYEAMRKADEWGQKKIPVGIFYKQEKPTYESEINSIKKDILINKKINKRNVSVLFDKFR